MFDPKTRILVVDDMMTMRKLITKILKDIGFTDISDASDGNLAWDAVNSAEIPFGLIISDWNMPNCTGLEFLKRVRADERFIKTPFLLVTAEAEQHQVAEAVKAGVSQYLVKPFSHDSLKAKLEMVHKKVS
ncbi:MAG: response regulator [Bacteriovorax sp.]|jgi:two-component system chemotaxis response regulator CheY